MTKGKQRMRAALLVFAGAACLLAGTGCRREIAQSPAQHLAHGWNGYCQGAFDSALREFTVALRQVPTNCALRQQILHGLAVTWDLRRPGEDPARSRQLYREAIAIAPTNNLSAWCWLALARQQAQPVAGEPADLQKRCAAYQEVIDRFPFHPAGEEAFLHQQAARLEDSRAEPARRVLAALDPFIQAHPHSPWLCEAWHLVGACCEIMGLPERKLDAAVQEWKTQETDPLDPSPDLSRTYWSIATTAEFDVGDFALARQYYCRLISEYPTDQKGFLARKELQHMDAVEDGMRAAQARTGGGR